MNRVTFITHVFLYAFIYNAQHSSVTVHREPFPPFQKTEDEEHNEVSVSCFHVLHRQLSTEGTIRFRGHDGALSNSHPSLQQQCRQQDGIETLPPGPAAKGQKSVSRPPCQAVMDAMWARLKSLSTPSATFLFNTGTVIP